MSIKRIQNFMLYEEIHEKAAKNGKKPAESLSSLSSNSESDQDMTQADIERLNAAHLSQAGVIIKNLNARWNEDSTDSYTLKNLSLRAQPGTLVAVVGQVGAGKSSLLQAILGELPPESGSIQVNGAVSYASQEP